jgi:hypothetical protein
LPEDVTPIVGLDREAEPHPNPSLMAVVYIDPEIAVTVTSW